MNVQELKAQSLATIKDKIGRNVVAPLNNLVDTNLADITTTIGSFAVHYVRGKFERQISFTVGRKYYDEWMEEALYAILRKYNDLKKSSKLTLSSVRKDVAEGKLYSKLQDGVHNLKYRGYNIVLYIATSIEPNEYGRRATLTTYTVAVYNLDPKFVTFFEQDMIQHRNAILAINRNSNTVPIYRDYHEGDGTTYWERLGFIPKRSIKTIYLPKEIKQTIVDTVNNFFASREEYRRWGIPHNLKILLHGVSSGGKDSIARMIASEWNRNIFYVSGGKNGQFIPNALIDNDDEVSRPLYIISDIDKYPGLVKDTKVNLEDPASKAEQAMNKQFFGNMINALDGILSGEDKIIIMTTNYIENFDPVFLRPGRIDLCLEIPPVQPEVFRKFIFDFYGKELPKTIKFKEKEVKMSSLHFDTIVAKMSFEDICKKYIK